MTSLKYGDEPHEKEIGDAAIERNLEFKKRMVTNYNQQNENRKHMQLGYLPPTKLLKQYAIELGLKLLEPYAIREEERAGIAKASIENEELRKKILAQDAEMAEIKAMMKQYLTARPPEPPEDEKPKSDLRVKKDGKWVKEGG